MGKMFPLELCVDYEFCQGMQENGEFTLCEFSYHVGNCDARHFQDGYDNLGEEFSIDPTTAVVEFLGEVPCRHAGKLYLTRIWKDFNKTVFNDTCLHPVWWLWGNIVKTRKESDDGN